MCRNEIKEIIQYHQEHRNLTYLAYQSAWMIMVNELSNESSLEKMITKKLHFVRESARELGEMIKSVEWTRKKGREGEDVRTEMKKLNIIRRWRKTIVSYYRSCTVWSEETADLLSEVVNLCKKAKEFAGKGEKSFIMDLWWVVSSGVVCNGDMLRSGVVDFMLGEITRETMSLEPTYCSGFFVALASRLKKKSKKEEKKWEKKEEKKKEAEEWVMRRKIIERMEEEGYEDSIIGIFMVKISTSDMSWFEDPLSDYLFCL
eukprot:MONOS_15407.1-p1 / transcript=MONOS_15407.1 / gene=MONOS_15407 / organism=Monocercomonoides_exilis_PA203 / gene_product=unspecified product / transcript_product=unspecified product / location=Mono_scaffold01223:6721-7500(-) / protein_length=260 / sequence_SO=supercontig / SO=protein_coding / is_pseudo=false